MRIDDLSERVVATLKRLEETDNLIDRILERLSMHSSYIPDSTLDEWQTELERIRANDG